MDMFNSWFEFYTIDNFNIFRDVTLPKIKIVRYGPPL
jgi:hypothetical protein